MQSRQNNKINYKTYQIIKLIVNKKKFLKIEEKFLRCWYWKKIVWFENENKKITQKLHYILIINTSYWSEHSLSRSVTLWYEITWIIDYVLSNNISSWSEQLLV